MKTRELKKLLKGSSIPVVRVTCPDSYQDHNVCGVRLILDTTIGTFEAHGSAMRNPIDEENRELAQTLAIARALDSLSRGLHRRANGLMKQQDDMIKSKAVHKDRPEPELKVPKKTAKKIFRK